MNNNIKKMQADIKANQKKLKKMIQENILEIINSMLESSTEEIKFLFNLLIKHQSEWNVPVNGSSVSFSLLLETLPNPKQTRSKLINNAEKILGRNISQFCDERFGRFMIVFSNKGKFTINYYQKSGYGECGECEIQLVITDNGKHQNIKTVKNSFYSNDPYIPKFKLKNPGKMVEWMMSAF